MLLFASGVSHSYYSKVFQVSFPESMISLRFKNGGETNSLTELLQSYPTDMNHQPNIPIKCTSGGSITKSGSRNEVKKQSMKTLITSLLNWAAVYWPPKPALRDHPQLCCQVFPFCLRGLFPVQELVTVCTHYPANILTVVQILQV